MIEDKLDHDERLRLECIAQAVASYTMGPKVNTSAIILRASRFEDFIREGYKPNADYNRPY